MSVFSGMEAILVAKPKSTKKISVNHRCFNSAFFQAEDKPGTPWAAGNEFLDKAARSREYLGSRGSSLYWV
jgi:hypothetical protein